MELATEDELGGGVSKYYLNPSGSRPDLSQKL